MNFITQASTYKAPAYWLNNHSICIVLLNLQSVFMYISRRHLQNPIDKAFYEWGNQVSKIKEFNQRFDSNTPLFGK